METSVSLQPMAFSSWSMHGSSKGIKIIVTGYWYVLLGTLYTMMNEY